MSKLIEHYAHKLIDLTEPTEYVSRKCPICDAVNSCKPRTIRCKQYLDGSYTIDPQIHAEAFALCESCGFPYNSALLAHDKQTLMNTMQTSQYQETLHETNPHKRTLHLLVLLYPNSLRYHLWLAHYYAKQHDEKMRQYYLNKVIELAKPLANKTLRLKSHSFVSIPKLHYKPKGIYDASGDFIAFSYDFFLIDWYRQAGRFDEAIQQIEHCRTAPNLSLEQGHFQYLQKEEKLIAAKNSRLL